MADNAQVAKLTRLRAEWLDQLNVSKTNSVGAQLVALTWDVVAYEIFREAVRLAPDAEEGGKQLNGLVFNLLSRGFHKSFMTDVRRLADKRRSHNSLRRLLQEIQSNSAIMTRGSLLECERLPYDWTELAHRENEEMNRQFQRGAKVAVGPDYIGSSNHIVARHEQIDVLCGVSADRRDPNDRPTRKFFQNLIDKLSDASSGIKSYVDHNIAHAASEIKLESANVSLVSLGELHNAHRELCQIAGFLNLYVLGATQLSFYSYSLADPFAFMGSPLLRPEHVMHLQHRMESLEREYHAYSSWVPKREN